MPKFGAFYRDSVVRKSLIRLIGSVTLLIGGTCSALDSLSFTQRASQLAGVGIRDIVHGNGTYVAVGTRENASNSGIIHSKNGITWSRAADHPSGYWPDFYGVTYGEGKYVAVGSYGVILSSTNGHNWSCVANNSMERLYEQFGSISFYDVTYGNGLFVAAGSTAQSSSVVAYSHDGLNWQGVGFNNPSFFDGVFFEEGKFYGTGDSGVIATSANGVNWQIINTNVLSIFGGFAYGDGTYVSVGEQSGEAIYSSNGTTWSQSFSTSLLGSEGLESVTFSNGHFIGVGYSFTGNSPIITSSNGRTWKRHQFYSNEVLFRVYATDDLVIVGGSNGLLLTSSPPDVPKDISVGAIISLLLGD